MTEQTYEQYVQDTDSHIYPSRASQAQIEAERNVDSEIDTPTVGHYRAYCAWCDCDIGPAPADCWWDTHGICADCDRKLRERAGLPAREAR